MNIPTTGQNLNQFLLTIGKHASPDTPPDTPWDKHQKQYSLWLYIDATNLTPAKQMFILTNDKLPTL